MSPFVEKRTNNKLSFETSKLPDGGAGLIAHSNKHCPKNIQNISIFIYQTKEEP